MAVTPREICLVCIFESIGWLFCRHCNSPACRLALEWLIDQYRVKTDPRTSTLNDPNRPDDPQYIVRLFGKVISVSLETVELVAGLPELGIEKAEPVVDASGDS